MAFLLALIVATIIVILSMRSLKSYTRTSPKLHDDEDNDFDYQYMAESISKPKIGAEVSDSLYSEVQQYCRDNSLTVSALIRQAVRFYMDSN